MARKGVMLKLFHGRNRIDQEMDDWGYDGPVLGPFDYIHFTYLTDIKFACDEAIFREQFPGSECRPYKGKVEGFLDMAEDCVKHDGKYYGDWSITSAADEDLRTIDEMAAALVGSNDEPQSGP